MADRNKHEAVVCSCASFSRVFQELSAIIFRDTMFDICQEGCPPTNPEPSLRVVGQWSGCLHANDALCRTAKRSQSFKLLCA